jgi:IclR family negative regulator of allantoin and glyoxylate utilization operon
MLAFMNKDELNEYLKQVQLAEYTPNTITDKDKLLKELEETRQQGYSINRGEHIFGRAAVGVPIFGRLGKLVASLCIVDSPSNILGESIDDLAKKARQTAIEISMNMGYFPGPITD